MAYFQCILSGNVIETHSQYDTDCFRRQTYDYMEVDENKVPVNPDLRPKPANPPTPAELSLKQTKKAVTA